MSTQEALALITAFCTDLCQNGLAAYDKYPVHRMETAYEIVAREAGVDLEWLSEVSVDCSDTLESLREAYESAS